MALTNFAALTDEQLTIWSKDTWKAARNNMFLSRFVGDGAGSMVQRITELKESEKGARAVITLVADLEGDGVAGDRTLEGNEESMVSRDQVIRIDQLRHANRHEGRIADQKSVVTFRENSRDVLSYWLSDRMDQLSFLSAAGVSYAFNTNGSARVGSDLINLEFAADVTAPTTNRHLILQGGVLTPVSAGGSEASITAGDTPSWRMLVEAKAFAKDNFIRPIRDAEGMEMYNVFMTPQAIAKLKLDPDFLAAWKDAMPRSANNPLFKGMPVIYVDGLAIYEYRHVYNVVGAPVGSKFGAAGDVNGQRALFCGAQSLGFADIGDPYWVEKEFDYKNQPGISLGKMCGLKKPVFHSQVTNQDEDFGLMVVSTAQ